MAAEQDVKMRSILAAAAHVEPEQNIEHMREAVERYADETEEQLKADLKTGLFMWERKPARERLRAFMESTLAEDLPLILIDDYMDMRQAGLAPKLRCETMKDEQEQLYVQQLQIVQQAAMLGQQMPPPEEPQQEPWWFWALVLRCRPVVFETLQRELLKLLKDQARRRG